MNYCKIHSIEKLLLYHISAEQSQVPIALGVQSLSHVLLYLETFCDYLYSPNNFLDKSISFGTILFSKEYL